MKTRKGRKAPTTRGKAWTTGWRKHAKRVAVCGAALGFTVWSAIAAKEAGKAPAPLAAVNLPSAAPVVVMPVVSPVRIEPLVAMGAPELEETVAAAAGAAEAAKPAEPAFDDETMKYASDPNIRWFDGRPVRPAREMWMEVTAYSPDARSCPGSDDGITATLHSVETNGFALVAADPNVLPYGSMLTVPGYDQNRIVPVLDCGGAIKGRRLDVLYPTHEQARTWGRQRVKVIVWEFADGKPAVNPRKLR